MSFWQADSQKDFEEVFDKYKVFYKEVLEIIPVITPMESMKLIMSKMKNQ